MSVSLDETIRYHLQIRENEESLLDIVSLLLEDGYPFLVIVNELSVMFQTDGGFQNLEFQLDLACLVAAREFIQTLDERVIAEWGVYIRGSSYDAEMDRVSQVLENLLGGYVFEQLCEQLSQGTLQPQILAADYNE